MSVEQSIYDVTATNPWQYPRMTRDFMAKQDISAEERTQSEDAAPLRYFCLTPTPVWPDFYANANWFNPVCSTLASRQTVSPGGKPATSLGRPTNGRRESVTRLRHTPAERWFWRSKPHIQIENRGLWHVSQRVYGEKEPALTVVEDHFSSSYRSCGIYIYWVRRSIGVIVCKSWKNCWLQVDIWLDGRDINR